MSIRGSLSPDADGCLVVLSLSIESAVKSFGWLLAIGLSGLAGGCTYPQMLNIPIDASGRSVNSLYADLQPALTGQYIVWISDRGTSQDLYLYDLKSRQLIDLPGLNAVDSVASHPDLSADGRYIVFAASRQGRSNIFIYDRQLRTLKNLTENLNADVRHPTISSDGTIIAFESNARGQWDIVLYTRSGQPVNVPNY